MKVWQVKCCEQWEDSWTVGIYDSLKKAEAVKVLIDKSQEYYEWTNKLDDLLPAFILKKYGKKVKAYDITNRLDRGYGPNKFGVIKEMNVL